MEIRTEHRSALVIGATGGIGGETATALLEHGWSVRALTRDVARAERDFARLGAVQWVRGDAMRDSDVVAAARGTHLIVHAANPPGYRHWRALALPMLDNTIAAARANGARVVLPGNVYNFGPDAGAVVAENAPQHPQTRKAKCGSRWRRCYGPPRLTACVRSWCAPAITSGHTGQARGSAM